MTNRSTDVARPACLIAIGTELALGQSVDTNSAWLAARLAHSGVRCDRHVTIADDLDAITAAVTQAARSASVVLITGGLGPTEDDLTRDALAVAIGARLCPDEASLVAIQAFFTARNRPMSERNRVQAMIPEGAEALLNDCGTAPGILVDVAGTPVFAMPGVPSEMRRMFDTQVLPRLANRGISGRAVIRNRHLRTYGMAESELGEKVRDLMRRGANPEVGTTAELGEIGIRVNASAATAGAAERMLDECEAEIRQRLGIVVFGTQSDTLSSVVGRLLDRRGHTVVTAESCTGGLLGSILTDTPGSSRYFLGGMVAYSDRLKIDLLGVRSATVNRFGAVSGEVAVEMAEGARDRTQADWSIAITGIAGPDGGSVEKPVGLVFIALAGPGGTRVRDLRLGPDSSRESVRIRSARTALNLLRMQLLSDE